MLIDFLQFKHVINQNTMHTIYVNIKLNLTSFSYIFIIIYKNSIGQSFLFLISVLFLNT